MYAEGNYINISGYRWRKLLLFTLNVRGEVGGICNVHGGSSYKILFGPRELKRALGRSERVCDSNLKLDFVDVVREDMNWIYLAKSMFSGGFL
jgi:hypothetical protein